jgi:hypothetical protein
VHIVKFALAPSNVIEVTIIPIRCNITTHLFIKFDFSCPVNPLIKKYAIGIFHLQFNTTSKNSIASFASGNVSLYIGNLL